ncbi:hypothetical protein ACRRTK_023547 [Alexandromys fortis]
MPSPARRPPCPAPRPSWAKQPAISRGQFLRAPEPTAGQPREVPSVCRSRATLPSWSAEAHAALLRATRPRPLSRAVCHQGSCPDPSYPSLGASSWGLKET